MILHLLDGWIEQATAIVAPFEIGLLDRLLVCLERILDWILNGANFIVPRIVRCETLG